jgi:uncharacterized membrane protein HdeD (DUF308 family)
MPVTNDSQPIQSVVATSLHAHWKFFLIEGLILLVLGVVAIVVPPLATVAVEIFVGWIVLVSGIVGLVATLRIVAGVVLLAWPLSGALSLTVILTVFLAAEGIASIMYALDHRRDLTPRWSLMLVSGLVDLVLAGIIFAGLPGTAAWAIGLLLGINLVFGGIALIGMALRARTLAAA